MSTCLHFFGTKYLNTKSLETKKEKLKRDNCSYNSSEYSRWLLNIVQLFIYNNMVRYNTIGVMSGSSLDGLDIAYVEFYFENKEWKYLLMESHCYPYTSEWVDRLSNLHKASAFDYQLTHHELGNYIGECINHFISTYNINKKELVIGSHGHTIFHEPGKGFSSQIGCGGTISALTNCTTVTDLRTGDVALGGQGAPIVPIGERNLWSSYSMHLNIGGIANISIVLPTGSIGYDICAANRVLNLLSNKINLDFDKDGKIARSGQLNNYLLTVLNKADYNHKAYPKTLNNSYGTDYIYNIINEHNISIEDALHTYTEHIAIQISHALNNHQKIMDKPSELLITGGGAYNKYLVDRIQYYISQDIKIVIPTKLDIEYKEAIIMAFIGILRVLNKTNVLASVTGAKRNSVNGSVWKV